MCGNILPTVASHHPGIVCDNNLQFDFGGAAQPILVAAAIDYDTKNGNVHGAISKLVESRAKDQRLEQLGLTPPSAPGTSWPPKSEIAIRREKEREMEGGTILIGRHTFKEYMHGLKRGWTVPITVDKVDEEEALAMTLADDGVFDERDTPPGVSEFGGDDDIPTHVDSGNPAQTGVTAAPPRSALFSPLQTLRAPPGLTARTPSSSSSPASPTHSLNPALTTPPATIPAQPPILLVSFPNRLGFLNVPLMIVDFFNERRNVRNGCEAAYKLVLAYTRDIRGPTSSSEPTDLDFAIDTEKNYRSSYNDTPKVISKARESYYTELGDKIALARTLAREEREPTKDEVAYPPKTEVELRAQRLAKEKKWREEEEAFTFVKAGEGVQWDERFEGGVLRVFREPSMEEEREFEEGRSGKFQ